MKKDKAKRVTIYVDAEVYQKFKIQAIVLGKSVSELLEEYMREQVKIYK